MRTRLLVALLITALSACASRNREPSAGRAEDHYRRCASTADNLNPLLVEWPSTQRSALEAQLRRSDSLIVVRYTGCEMDILRDCRVDGSYRFTQVTPKHDQLEIRNSTDVWMKVPLGAAKLITEVERHGALHLDMQIVGEWAGPASPTLAEQLVGPECHAATHVVGSLMVGAFEIKSIAGGGVKTGAEMQGFGAGVGAERHRGYYSSDGAPQTCREDSGYGYDDYSSDCRSPLQIELRPVTAAVSKDSLRCPAGMAFIDVFDSGFCLDVNEVTVQDYADCAKDHTCSEAPATVDWAGITDEEHDQFDHLCNQDRSARRNHPANCLTWDQAASYCSAQGKRLPELMEWHMAAQGGDQNRTYPWGEDSPSHRHVNACGKECKKGFDESEEPDTAYRQNDGFVGTAPIGSFPKGTARWELLDMAGNVWEWTADPAWNGIAIVGGSARSGSFEELKSTSLQSEARSVRRFDVGFRCAADPAPADRKRRARR